MRRWRNFLGRRLLPTLVASVFVGGILFTTGSIAKGGHTLPANTGGDCWRSSTPLWCRTSWASAPYHQIRMRFIDQFSGQESGWLDNIEAACNNWHNYVPSGSYGDIWCHWVGVPNDTFIYWKWASPALPSGVYARTFNCNTSSVCSSSSSQSMNVWWSEVHMNRDAIRSLSETRKTMMFAHETGHTLGLFHHDGNYLMNSTPNDLTGPTATDYGRKPPCSGGYTTYGVRCVFNFTQ